MFDGSHRTNKREINYSGASSSSRTSRKANLTLARQQRLARAQAKAKLNASIVIQRCWRGVRTGSGDGTGRKGIARALDGRFQAIVTDALNDASDSSSTDDANQHGSSVAILATLLAFRLSPALSSFYTSTNDISVEESMRQDLLKMEKLLTTNTQQISPIAARRLTSVTLLLLRQSVSRRNMGKEEEEENRRMISLLNYLLQTIFSSTNNTAASRGVVDDLLQSNRPSDYYMSILRRGQDKRQSKPAWMINLFSCLRDYVIFHRDINVDNGEKATAMDVDDDKVSNPYDLELLLKWCCKTVLHLASTSDQQDVATAAAQNLQGDDVLSTILQYQQGIALLASILFIAPSVFGKSWLDTELTQFLRSLTQMQQQGGAADAATSDKDLIPWSPIFTHYLSCAIMCGNNSTPSNNDQIWSTALCETLNNHECSVLHHIVMQADVYHEQRDLYTYSVPVILQYTLQRHHDLATLTTFAARGENISSWIEDDKKNNSEISVADAAATAAYATDGMDVDDDDDDDEEDESLRSQSVSIQQPSQRDKRSTSTSRYSRQDLQTLPKLDALYQTKSLLDKKSTTDRLRALSRGARGIQIEVQCMISLAKKVGKGQWMLSLSNSLFTPTTPQLSSFGLVSSSQLLLLQTKAQECYPSALSSVLTSCSGSKAGRNAASPLLAKLAFHNPSLFGLWECSSQNVSLLTRSQSSKAKIANSPQLVAAYEVFSSFCDLFSHHLLAVDDDEFLDRYFSPTDGGNTPGKILASDVVLSLKKILNDLYWVNPVLAADISETNTNAESILRFQRARLLISGTKLWNSLHERWCRLYRNVQFCDENSWWFPFLAGQHDSNPIIHSQVTTFGDQNDDDEVMDESSVESVDVDEGDAGGDALASSFRDPKMARVLTAIPQAMPFSRRVNLFQSLIDSDKLLMQDEEATFRHMMMNLDNPEQDGEMGGRVRVTIHRDALYSDSMNTLNPLGKKLRKKVQVTFVNQHGATEAGIDGGGVFKEFLDDLIKDAFIPQATKNESGEEEQSSDDNHPDFFSVTPLQTLQVNLDSDGDYSALSHYEFLGRVLGKAIYESILVDPQLALPFLNKLLGKQNSLDDLKNMDPEFYKHIKSLRYMSAQDINSLGLTFETTAGKNKTVELIHGGSNILVTKDNVIQYIHLVSHQRMNIAGSRQTHAFLHGFRDIIPAPWVRLFSAYEFQKLISGDDAVQGIDVQGMMNVTRYSGGLHPSQPIVQWLWEVVNEMNSEQQRKFLKFMTSCSRQPLLGFKSLAPAPCVQQTRLREDNRGVDIAEESPIGNIRLPTSSTCMNLLKLPKYTSKEMLRDKLLYAIEAAAGFELS
ncbi:HECT-type E3 ubiquitin-protein ligase [Skeletonema marinoi]|uniref:HECT-type E3 ubiquitin transferase n=1 Tax=Skeletonema marinoi TaxID=267567 RepID=A0AAD8YML1_9STRA|nr:HECT-type E3 ubiquitin-protein ligase [Skeletonema marinoi]